MSDSLQNQQKRVAIVGGGLVINDIVIVIFFFYFYQQNFKVGSLNACFFAQRGWIVDLFEAREGMLKLMHCQKLFVLG